MKIRLDRYAIKILNMAAASRIVHPHYKRHVFHRPGVHHYRLLTYLSLQLDGVSIADVGTRRGASAYCLALNPNNTVTTFDINAALDLNEDPNKPDNVKFVCEDCTRDVSLITGSDLIFLDVSPHDGVQEKRLLEGLIEADWGGLLLMDDIRKFDGLRQVWEAIELPKMDLTAFGHCSGTGLVNFGDHRIELK